MSDNHSDAHLLHSQTTLSSFRFHLFDAQTRLVLGREAGGCLSSTRGAAHGPKSKGLMAIAASQSFNERWL